MDNFRVLRGWRPAAADRAGQEAAGVDDLEIRARFDPRFVLLALKRYHLLRPEAVKCAPK